MGNEHEDSDGAVNVIIFSNRLQVRNALRDEFKQCGVGRNDIYVIRSVSEYSDKARELENDFLLALDWEMGPEKIIQILEKNRNDHKLELRPTFLFAAELDSNVVAVAGEFFVSKVHTGEITGDLIHNEVLALVKDSRNLSAMRRVYAQIDRHRVKGEWHEALEFLLQLHAKFPDNHRITIELGETFMELDRWDEAEDILKSLMSEDPTYARAMTMYARCRLKKGDQEGAIDCLKKAHVVSPYNIARLAELGQILLESKRSVEAKKAFDDILKIAPESKEGQYGKSASMLILGEVNEALSLLREAANSRELAAVFNTSAILAIRQGNFETGMNLYRIAMSVLGDRPKVVARLYYNMGIGFHKWDKEVESINCFREAQRLDPEYSDAKHNIEALDKLITKKHHEAKSKAPIVDGLKWPAVEEISKSRTAGVGGDQVSRRGEKPTDASFDTNLDSAFDEDDF